MQISSEKFICKFILNEIYRRFGVFSLFISFLFPSKQASLNLRPASKEPKDSAFLLLRYVFRAWRPLCGCSGGGCGGDCGGGYWCIWL